MTEKGNVAATSLTMRRLLNLLRDSSLVNWQWTEAKALTLTFTWDGFAGGEGHDIILCLRGVSQMIFDSPDDNGAGYVIHEASLTREVIKGSGKVRYRLELEGNVTMEVACQIYDVFTQTRLAAAELDTKEVDDVTFADVKKAFAELDGAFADLEAGRADHNREMAEMQAETRENLQRSEELTKEWQRSR